MTLDCRKSVRLSEVEAEIVEKVRKELHLPSDSSTIRFIIHFWWKSLGSDAVDIAKLSNVLRAYYEETNGKPDEDEI